MARPRWFGCDRRTTGIRLGVWGAGSSAISQAVAGVAKVSSILGRDAHPSWEMVATKRLLLRRWRSADRLPFAAMNADPEVMEFFPRTLTRVESDQFMDRIEAGWELRGFGWWVVELMESKEWIGFTGMSVPSIMTPTGNSVAGEGWASCFGLPGGRRIWPCPSPISPAGPTQRQT